MHRIGSLFLLPSLLSLAFLALIVPVALLACEGQAPSVDVDDAEVVVPIVRRSASPAPSARTLAPGKALTPDEALCRVYGHPDACRRIGEPSPFEPTKDEAPPVTDWKHDKDLSCGAFAGHPFTLVDGPTGPGPDTAIWSPFHSRFFISVAALPSESMITKDLMGWIVQTGPDGQYYSPLDGYGPQGVVGQATYAPDLQIGYRELSNPLGVTVDPLTGAIAVLDMALHEYSDSTGLWATALYVYDAGGTLQHKHLLWGILTPSDITRRSDGSLMIVDGAWAEGETGRIWVVTGWQTATPSKYVWADMGSEHPSRIRTRFEISGAFTKEVAYVTTTTVDPLGGGRLYRYDMATKARSTRSTPAGHRWSGLTWGKGTSVLLADPDTVEIFSHDSSSANVTTGLYNLRGYMNSIEGIGSAVVGGQTVLFVPEGGTGRPNVYRLVL